MKGRQYIYSASLLIFFVLSGFAMGEVSPGLPAVADQARNGEGTISALDLRDIDIKDAVKLIAQKSGLNIAVGDSVQGRVTVYLENIPAREALATVLQLSHFAFEDNGGLIQVISEQDYQTKYGHPFSQRVSSRVFHLKGMKAPVAAALLERLKNPFGKVVADDVSGTVYAEDTTLKLSEFERYLKDVDPAVESRSFSLNYIEAETMAAKLNGILTNGVGSARPDKQSNKIFVTDTSEKLDAVANFLKEVDVPRKPFVVELGYARAEEMSPVIKQYLTPGFGTIEINKRANQLIVMDTAAKVQELSEIIQVLDRKEPEVLIEARIVQVVLRDEFRLGVDWDAVVKGAHGLELKTAWGGVGSSGKASLAIGTLSDDNYRAVIEALGSVNKSHVLSNPRVAVINNQEARILVGTTKPYVTTTTTTPSSGPVSVSEEVKFIDVGVKLVVTPTVHPDGYITMKIRPEVSSAANSIRTGQNNVIPVVDTSEVETTVRVKDGVTIVIGGLIKDEKTRQDFKVPLLGDIPVVGLAFRNTGRTKEQTEIVIFLTPRIISGDLK
jgi:type II secretory pathway component GspD/PulD (secretin)